MIGLLIMLALLGLAAYLLVRFVPMPQGVKTLIIIVAVIGGVLYALDAFGVGFPTLPVPHVR